MKKTKLIAWLLLLAMVLGLTACGKPAEAPAADGAKILRVAESFMYPTLDAHNDYCGWGTSNYGLTETLFRLDDRISIQPLLAEKAQTDEDGLVWTITLRKEACFSNGKDLTAEMVVRNLRRLGEMNDRFAYLNDYELSPVDATTLTIRTPGVVPTMLNDLAAPEMAILDLDSTTDVNNAPICTGPFVVSSFTPETKAEVVRNEHYWGGEVKLDGAVFYWMQDDDSKLMAMQSREIDAYSSVTAAAGEIYRAQPDTYTLTEVPATRLQFYVLNENTLSEKVRAAINLTVDCEAMAAYLNGTVSAAVGMFSTAAPYGQVTKPAPDTAAAMALLEADGYTRNSDGIYEKDGEPLRIQICYYAARSLDTLAILMQEQLKAIGVDSVLRVEEDPDGTYIATGDFDVALYCAIADKAGDPYYYIDALLRQDSRWRIAGFRNDQCEALIDALQYETDPEKRAALANEIVQLAIDSNCFGFVGLFNKNTVTVKGVTNFSENCPFDFYELNKDTDIIK